MITPRIHASAEAYPISKSTNPVRDNVDSGEDLEGVDQLDDKLEEDRRREHRQRDEPQPRPETRAVQRGGLVQRGRDILQPREIDDRAAADAPQVHQHDARQRPTGAVEPAGAGDVRPFEQHIDDAVLRVEEPEPHQ